MHSFSVLALALVMGSAAAFAPARNAAPARVAPAGYWYGDLMTGAANFDVKKQAGAQMPLGYFDPMGLLKDADEETFVWWRQAELKHGRIAQMAVLGHIITAKGDRFPGAEGVPAGLGAFFGPDHIPGRVMLEMIFAIGLLDIGYTSRQAELEKIHLDKSKWDAKTIERRRAVELNNGRAAMMGIWGLVTHEMIDGKPYVINELMGMHVGM